MTKLFYPDFFNDVFGPIMQPGSSSNFAGNSRVGRIARHALKSELKRARILFDPGNGDFATLGNMMEDRGFLGGLQDFAPDDARLYSAHELARAAGISYEFAELDTPSPWPDSVTFELTGAAGDTARVTARSIGGGMVTTYQVHGFPVRWQADTHAVLAWGDAQALAAADAAFAGLEALVESATYTDDSGRVARFWEFSKIPDAALLQKLFAGAEYRVFPALLPVVTHKGRKPQLFRDVAEWRQAAQELNLSFVETAIEYEKRFSGWSEGEIWAYFEKLQSIWDHQIHSLEEAHYDESLDTPNLPIYGLWWDRYRRAGRVLEDPLTDHIIVHAMSTNAKLPGVKIVPGPMGTGGGYLYSAVSAVSEKQGSSHERVIESLIVAAGLGAIAFTHCQASGNSGCVGESGVCCAMGSGALTWLAGGDGAQVEHAASMAIQANIGIPCDPIPGGKEFPCITRTIRAAVTMPLYADLALAGIDPLIPYHEALQAVRRYQEATPAHILHGGCTTCPSAQRCQAFLQGELMAGKIKYEAE